MLWMQGLITKERKELDPSATPFAKDLREIEGLMHGDGLVEVVNFTGLLRLV
jgi:malate dehydrogenase (decarboxylating)